MSAPNQQIETAKRLAYTHTENAFRGTDFWLQGVIYTKLKVYYEGLRKNAEYIADNADDIECAIDRAMLGKYDHANPKERADINAALAARS